MITVLFEGMNALSDDSFLLSQIFRSATKDPLYGVTVQIGIGNQDGDIYRMVQCQGRRQAESVTACLRSLNFVELPTRGSGYHYVFQRRT